MPKSLYLIIFLLLFIACKSPEARRPVSHATGSFIKQSALRNKAIFEKEEQLFKALIKADSLHTYYASQQGFWYYYDKKDTIQSRTPKIGDTVIFRYSIKHLNNKIILSEEELGDQYYIVDKTNQDLISGIRDGIKLMKEGETVTFLLPSFKAYGYYGIENKLGTNVPVKSTVTLKSISISIN
jgi:gliding motility-associated peptidyl-prolyl isomerase